MSNKKRIQKKIYKIELMKFGKFVAAMSNLVSFFKEWKERQKSLKLISIWVGKLTCYQYLKIKKDENNKDFKKRNRPH